MSLSSILENILLFCNMFRTILLNMAGFGTAEVSQRDFFAHVHHQVSSSWSTCKEVLGHLDSESAHALESCWLLSPAFWGKL